MLDANELRLLVDYDGETGIFRYKSDRGGMRAGDRVGNDDGRGYWQTRINYKSYRLHRLAWLYTYGSWPRGYIDHINGDKSDNRISNLRECTHAENQQNHGRKPPKSGYVGVSKNRNKFEAYVSLNGVRVFRKWFDTAEEAHAAYLAAKAKYHTFSPDLRGPSPNRQEASK